MLTTVLDLVGLAAVIAAVLLGSAVAFGAVGLMVGLFVVAAAALSGSWLVDRLRS